MEGFDLDASRDGGSLTLLEMYEDKYKELCEKRLESEENRSVIDQDLS